MSENWDSFFARVDGQVASIFVDLALVDEAPISSEPHMAYVRIKMQRPRDDGLSSDEEFEMLSNLGDALTNGVVADGMSRYVGRNTSGGFRDFYFYTADPSAFVERVKAVRAGYPQYQFEVGDQLDPEWRSYFDFLYPGPDELLRIQNRRTTDALLKHGDDLSKPRMIEHSASVPSTATAATLTSFLRERGFKIEKPTLAGESVLLNFAAISRPDQMDEVIIPVAKFIRGLGGEYDGWGCEVEG